MRPSRDAQRARGAGRDRRQAGLPARQHRHLPRRPAGRPHRTPTELLRNADVAMYMAKRDSKGSYRVFEPAMHERVVERLELRADLQRAIELEQLELHYQPVVRLDGHEIIGVEALLRWNHPTRGTITPAQFIPLAEETGLIIPMGRWVLETRLPSRGCGCRSASPRDEPLTMSVNLSVRQLQSDSIVADVRVGARARRACPPASLVLEITESVMMADTEFAVERLDELKALGVRLAMDDFGTGYSSLSYLSRFPVDILKMDRSFVGASARTRRCSRRSSPSARASTSTSSQRASSFRSRRSRFSDLGCEIGQGFLFARPMGADALVGFLNAQPEDADVGVTAGVQCSIVTRVSTARAVSREASCSRRCSTATSACSGPAWRCRCSATGSSSSRSRGRLLAVERARGALDRRHRDDRADGRLPARRRRRQRPVDRRLVMIWADALRAAAVGVLAALVAAGRAAVLAARRARRRLRRRDRVLHARVRGDRARARPEPTTCPRRTRSTSSSGRSRSGWSGPLSAACSSRSAPESRSPSTLRRSLRRSSPCSRCAATGVAGAELAVSTKAARRKGSASSGGASGSGARSPRRRSRISCSSGRPRCCCRTS